MLRKSWLFVFTVLLATFLLLSAGIASAADGKNVITAKFGHSMNINSSYHYVAAQFAELVKEKTNGEVIIEIYPDAQLGSERELLESAMFDGVQFMLPTVTGIALYEAKLGLFAYPFLFENHEEAYALLDSDLVKDLFSVLTNHNVRFLAFCENGFRNVATANKPIYSLDDLKNLKIRVSDGGVYMDVWNLLGANPTPIAFGELYTALKTGVVDAVETPVGVFGTSGFGEVCKKYTILNYLYNPLLIVCSESFYQSLNPEQQKLLYEAAVEAGNRQREWVRKDDEQWQTKLEKDYGVEFVPLPANMAAFRDAVKPMYDNYEDQELLNKVMRALGR